MRLRGIGSASDLGWPDELRPVRKHVPSNVVAYATDKEDGHERRI